MIEPQYDAEDMAKISEYDSLRAEIERQHQENKRLRAALRDICDNRKIGPVCLWDAQLIARRALEGK